MRTRSILPTLAFVGLLAFAAPAPAPAAVRVALMDFSTEDNSYRSIQAAADFTSLVQMGLANESSIEWVERSQLHLAQTELALAQMRSDGPSPLKRGRMLGANWLISGHFSIDDQERHTLAFQIVDLEYSDVIASETIVLPDSANERGRFGDKQSEAAVAALRGLLTDAKRRTASDANRARVAFLFLADMSPLPFGRSLGVLDQEFREVLEHEAMESRRFRLVEFPKAYQSTEESELLADGMIEAVHEPWKRTADLYVWGTYLRSNVWMNGRPQSRLTFALHLWDGATQPSVVNESLDPDSHGRILPEQVNALMLRFAKKVAGFARVQPVQSDPVKVRRQLADSIVKAYVGKSGGMKNPTVDGSEGLVQVVHMLETACFFDPDNADARLLWLTCRYGLWVDFGHHVENEFWTKWRRSRAWGNYMERFGLRPGTYPLPFPYSLRGIQEPYVTSLADVIGLFPQWHSKEEIEIEDEWRKQGVHTWLVEAEAHGFPKDMPHDLALKWKEELQSELAQRRKKASAYLLTRTNSTSPNPVLPVTPSSAGISNSLSPARITPTGSAAPTTVRSAPQSVPLPAWLKTYKPLSGMFKLYPPKAFPCGVGQDGQKIRFPSRYHVKVVKQMACQDRWLWVLVMDEWSSPSSEKTPDLSAEMLDERCRLWRLEADSVKPVRYQPSAFPADINSFLLYNDQLWLAGIKRVSVWDLKKQQLRKFGLADGLDMQNVEALAVAGGSVFAAGGNFELASLEPFASHWNMLNKPSQNLSHGSEDPFLLSGHQQFLAYSAGGVFFYDLKDRVWTNVAAVHEGRCLAVDGAAFWIGAENGLHCYDALKQEVFSWNSPTMIQGLNMPPIGLSYLDGSSTVERQRLEELEAQVQGPLRKLQRDQKRVRVARLGGKERLDPLCLNSRIPGAVAAMAEDGDFIWLGANNYFGGYLLLVHKASLSLVAAVSMASGDRISSLAVSDQDVWVGTRYGDIPLLRFSKTPFLSVPRSQWLDLTLKPEEREQSIQGMSARDQALYAFYAGDDEQVVQLLAGLDPATASLEEMFLLGWSYAPVGVDDFQKAQAWFDHITSRYPESPWAKQAQECAKAYLALYARFDHNHDQKLDASEKLEMLKDEEALGINSDPNKFFEAHMDQVFKMCDKDGDQKLNRFESDALWRIIPMYFNVGMEIMPLRHQADANKDSYIDAAEFKNVMTQVRQIVNDRNKRH